MATFQVVLSNPLRCISTIELTLFIYVKRKMQQCITIHLSRKQDR